MTIMKINVYKFNPDAGDLAESVIEQVKSRLPRELTEMVGGTASEQLWDKGYYDSMGYRYFLDEGVRILVNRTNEIGNDWTEHVVPTEDPKIIEQYIKAFEDDDCAWILLKPEDIHVI